MRIHTHSAVALLLLCIALNGMQYAVAEVTQGLSSGDLVRAIASRDEKEWHKARSRLLEQRAEIIQSLTEQIRGQVSKMSNENSVRKAMLILGDIHATESLDVLINNIAYPSTAEVQDGPDRMTYGILPRYYLPAIDPLVKLGFSCEPHIISKLSRSDDLTERFACITVLRRLGKGVTRPHLVAAVAAAETDLEKARLAEALVQFDRWIPADEYVRRIRERSGR